jgi:predicted RNA-binding protein YlqC (UPF0109 family)
MGSASPHLEGIVLLTHLLRFLLEDPGQVSVTAIETGGKSTILSVKVAEGPEMGRIIGKQGRTARALRVILMAAGKKHHRIYQLEINGQQVDDGDVG